MIVRSSIFLANLAPTGRQFAFARDTRFSRPVKKFNIIDGFRAESSKNRPPQISSINHLTVFQCSKPCGGGSMNRKVICMKDNVTAPASDCDPSAIMFSLEDCNKQPCEEGNTRSILYYIRCFDSSLPSFSILCFDTSFDPFRVKLSHMKHLLQLDARNQFVNTIQSNKEEKIHRNLWDKYPTSKFCFQTR